MQIPEKIKIGGQMYSVGFYDTVDEDDKNIDGKIIYDSQLIRLGKNQHPEYSAKVFLHEVIHGVFDFLCYEQDENKVERLTNVLYQVLVDNKLHFDE